MTNLEKMIALCGTVADGLLLTSSVSRHYAAESGIDEGIAVVSNAGCRYFTDSRYIEAAEKQLKGFEVIMTDREHPFTMLINNAIADFGLKTLGVEENFITLGEYNSFCEKLNAELVCCQAELSKLRWSKEDWEIEKMLKAQEITDKTFAELLTVIRPGMTEKELCAELIYRLYRHGADALSLINTLRGMRIDINTGRPVLKMNTGGLSGPAVLPVAVRMVWEVANAVNIPILGMGGVSKGSDAAQLMMAGASAVAVGTACFADPYAPVNVRDELRKIACSKKLDKVSDLTGSVKPWQ